MSKNDVRGALIVLVAMVALLGVLVGLWAGAKAFGRYQRRADANNNVKVTNINIRKAQQQARIVHAQNAAIRAKAEQRVIEAEGIRKAQDLISKTLTPLYISHEAIKAQERMATSGRNNTSIYIPSGDNGVPLVNDISSAEK